MFKLGIVASSQGVLFPSDGLVSYWNMDVDGSITDLVGSNNGTIQGATYTSSGKINGGYSFDGGDDILFGESAFDIAAGNSFSISLWFKATDYDDNRRIFNKRSGTETGNPGYEAYINVNGQVTVSLDTGATNAPLSGSIQVDDGAWHHLVVSYDGSAGRAISYVDTVVGVDNSDASYGDGMNSQNQLAVGQPFSTESRFTGSIDEIGFWSRALTSDEVEALYNSGNGLTY